MNVNLLFALIMYSMIIFYIQFLLAKGIIYILRRKGLIVTFEDKVLKEAKEQIEKLEEWERFWDRYWLKKFWDA